MPGERSGRKSLSNSSQQSSELDGLYSPFSLAVLDWLSSRSWSEAGSELFLRLLLFVLYSVTFCFTVTSLLLIAPYVETRWFPVVSKMQISEMNALTPERTAVYASFEKLRDCDYVGIAWFHGSRKTGFERVPIQLLRAPGDISSPNRPLGRQTSGPWIVDIPIGEIRNNSFVELYHHCTPLWITATEFYP